MKFSAQYTSAIKHFEKFDEVIIKYEFQNEALIHFLQEHADRQVVLSISALKIKEFINLHEYEKLNAIYIEYPNFSVRFYEPCKFEKIDNELLEAVSKLKIPYFTGMCVNTFDQLNYLCQQGVSQVYITEEMGFDLMRAKRVCRRHGVQIRVFPNVAQYSIKQESALKTFFIRPEDLDEYSDCIDIVEFWGPVNRQEVLRKIYGNKRWFGTLQELILDFDEPIDSTYIPPSFGRMRKGCERRCMKGERCTACNQIIEISEFLKEKGIIVKPLKKH